MLTFTQAYQRTIDLTAVGTDQISIPNFKTDVNQAIRIFANSARRYWTRVEKTTDLVASQQYYTMPEDCVRVNQVTIIANGFNYPLKEIASEYNWNKINVLPTATLNVPQKFFVRGRNEVGLWPRPSATTTAGLRVSYEPRMPDLSIEDVTTGTVTVTNGQTIVTASAAQFNQNMLGSYYTTTDGTDGLWYKIVAVNSTSSITLENYYQGISGSGRNYLIGEVPDFPEDYHMALVYYATYNFFLKRKDLAVAEQYLTMFNNMVTAYKQTYSSKTTGIVITDDNWNQSYNLFTLPPNAIS